MPPLRCARSLCADAQNVARPVIAPKETMPLNLPPVRPLFFERGGRKGVQTMLALCGEQ